MMIQSILLFQKPPAFLISNYNIASYLHYIKNQGKQRTKEKDAGKHNLLHPLSAKENKCAESLGLNLTDTSKYEKLVQTFLTNTVASISKIKFWSENRFFLEYVVGRIGAMLLKFAVLHHI